MISILLQHHIPKLTKYFFLVSEVPKFQHHTKLCPKRSTLLVNTCNGHNKCSKPWSQTDLPLPCTVPLSLLMALAAESHAAGQLKRLKSTLNKVPYILESNPQPFYSFRGLKNQMRIRIACGLDSRSTAGFWKNDRASVRAVRTIQ